MRGEGATLAVRPLPEDGVPAAFRGAVGRFTIRAEAAPREITPGETLRLTLILEGEGNLEHFEAPDLHDLRGFHVYGLIEDRTPSRRTLHYDVAPLNVSVKEIPSIPFAFFDTRPPGRYRTVRTDTLPLTVRPASNAGDPTADPGAEGGRWIPGRNDIHGIKTDVEGSAPDPTLVLSPLVLAAGLAAPWLLALALYRLLRVRERNRADPEGLRARKAAARFRARIARRDTEPDLVLAEYLAARLRRPDAAVITPDLAARLTAAGVDEDLARETAEWMTALTAARYGGGSGDADPNRLTELVDRLEARFVEREVAE